MWQISYPLRMVHVRVKIWPMVDPRLTPYSFSHTKMNVLLASSDRVKNVLTPPLIGVTNCECSLRVGITANI